MSDLKQIVRGSFAFTPPASTGVQIVAADLGAADLGFMQAILLITKLDSVTHDGFALQTRLDASASAIRIPYLAIGGSDIIPSCGH